MNETHPRRRRRGLRPKTLLATAAALVAGAAATPVPTEAAAAAAAADVSCSVGHRSAYTDSDATGSWVVARAEIVCSPAADLIVVYAVGFRDGALLEDLPPTRCEDTTSCTMLVSLDNPPGSQQFTARYEAVGSVVGPPHAVSEVRPFNILFTG